MMQKEGQLIPQLRFPEFDKGWENKKLGNISTFSKGKGISKADIDEKGVNKCIRYGELYTTYNEIIDKVVSRTNVPLYKSVLSEKNDVIIPSSGETQLDIATASCVLKEGVILGGDLNIIKSKINGVFLAYLLNNSKKIDIAKLAQGNSVVHLYNKNLSSLLIQIPSNFEQQKIANFLTSIDNQIQSLEKKKSLLEQYKKGILQKIFKQELRFKDEDGNAFPKWELKKVSDLFRVTRGNVLSMTLVRESKDSSFKYPVYSSQTKNNGLSGYYDEYLYENAITWTTDGANAGDVNYRLGKFYCTNVCGVLLSDEGFANNFIAERLNSVTKKYVSYVGNPKLMNGVMSEIKIKIPCIAEQTKIANFLSAIDKNIALVNTKIEHTKSYKKGLLQQMFV